MLVDEHAYRYTAHVETIQEVLDVLVGDSVLDKGLLILYDALGHGWHYIVVPVPDIYQGVNKPKRRGEENS